MITKCWTPKTYSHESAKVSTFESTISLVMLPFYSSTWIDDDHIQVVKQAQGHNLHNHSKHEFTEILSCTEHSFVDFFLTVKANTLSKYFNACKFSHSYRRRQFWTSDFEMGIAWWTRGRITPAYWRNSKDEHIALWLYKYHRSCKLLANWLKTWVSF